VGATILLLYPQPVQLSALSLAAQKSDLPADIKADSAISEIETSVVVTVQSKMLYVIGLGLSDEKDITVKGLEVNSEVEVEHEKIY
jgi:hypothetical protein